MKKIYHEQLCQESLGEFFSPAALAVITAANTGQDAILRGFFAHPEFHFDESKFDLGWAYVESQRRIVREVLAGEGPAAEAWAAFGRLLHAVQDFYAHSNYTRLWAAHYTEDDLPPPAQFDGMNDQLIHNPDLRSGNVYYPLELLTFFDRTRDWATPRLPADSHANMNLDYPARGPLFWYAMEGARQRSAHELQTLLAVLNESQKSRFSGKV
ncbi:MAG: hypothetical protein EPO32_05975 [Anaerolineae bacterium]|nr:MAG: hypothetical protein EPO32_05975 [Anaerolineae bacterium]